MKNILTSKNENGSKCDMRHIPWKQTKRSVQTGSWFCIAEINRNSLNNSRVLDSKTYAQPVQDVPHQ